MKKLIGKILNTNLDTKNILSNIAWLIFDKVFRMVVGLFVGVWFARYLGPESFGIWNYVLALVIVFEMIPAYGLDSIVIKGLVTNKKEKNYILGSSFTLRIALSFIAYLLILITSFLLKSNAETVRLLAVISICFFFQSFDVIAFYYQSKVKSKNVVIVKNIAFAIATIFRIYYLLNEGELIVFAYLYLLEIILSALFLLLVYLKEHAFRVKWHFKKSQFNLLINQGFPLFLSSITIILYMKIDQIMIERMVGLKELGIYSVVVKLSELWFFVPVIISNSFFPNILNLKSNNEWLYKQKLKKLFSMLFYISVFITLIILVFGDTMIQLLYGDEYLNAIKVLNLHILGSLFVFIGVPASFALVAEGLQVYILYITIIALIVNVILNYIFIPIYGIQGAACASLISYSLGSCFCYSFFKKTYYLFLLQTKAVFDLSFFNLLRK